MSERTLRLFNTQSRQVEPLRTIEPGHLRFYSCGPTVYSYAHIGNFRTFLTADVVIRVAEALGWKVTYVSNITDVGHLTSDDQDGGEDRMEKGLKSKEGEKFASVWDLADYYAESFKADWTRLNLRRPYVWPKATQHMREQIVAVEQLIAGGHAYETPTGVYYSVGSFADYGKLSGNRNRDELMTAVRNVVKDDNKRHPADFALWKKDEKHLMQWFSPWGWGFPGWHLECSVMAMAYLGETLDLHAGGEDLIFPHHECEIAQSEALTGKVFANHWIHTRFLQVDGEKMSKSLGNFFTVRDLVDIKGADPMALRYALISQNYGTPHNFTFDLLRDATSKVERYRQCLVVADTALKEGRPGPDSLGEELERLHGEALDALCDDLNMSVALAKTLEGTKNILREGEAMSAASAESARRFIHEVNALMGFVFNESGDTPNGETRQTPAGIEPEEIENLIAQRADAKKNRDFGLADQIRQDLDAHGIELRDTPDGTVWKVKSPSL